MKHLKGIINKPPLCEACGKPMQAEVCPAEMNLNGTGITQMIAWSCPDCYDPIEEL